MANIDPTINSLSQEISSNSLTDYLGPVMDQVPRKESQGYVAPTDDQLADWVHMMTAYRNQDWHAVVQRLEPFAAQYKLVLLHDQGAKEDYYILVEQSPVTLGWGVYVQRVSPSLDVAIHVNHPISDKQSWEIGSEVFQSSNARYLFIAGAHRYANGEGSTVSDMARNPTSIFQKTHETVSHQEHDAVSIHGYTATQRYNDAINNSDVILSSGHSRTSPLMTSIAQTIEAAGLTANIFDAKENPELLNLSGRINPQLQYSNRTYGEGHFVHVEIESRQRQDMQWHTVARGIANGIDAFSTCSPE